MRRKSRHWTRNPVASRPHGQATVRTERSETMTRETKVGIVVSCSFVSLVGVVIASKLREGPPPPEPPASTAALESRASDAKDQVPSPMKKEAKPTQKAKGPPAAEKPGNSK